jgi:hypothetical protein
MKNADCETSVYNGKLQKDERKKKLTLSAEMQEKPSRNL